MAIIPSFFMDAVVSLGISLPNNEKYWVGTGFLVGRKEESNVDQSTVYIITNKHVINNQKALYVRFSNDGSSGVKDLPMSLIDDHNAQLFSAHQHPDVDVVAIQIIPRVIIDNHLRLSFFDLSDHALSLKQMKDTGVDEGSLVYAVGFPMNLVDNSVKAPICRLGCISRVEDAFENPQMATKFLVDAQVFPGNSGGPIVSRPEHISIDGTPHNSSANLIGIVSAYIPYREVLYSRQTGRDRMIQEENSGLSVVHPVDRIKEVVEAEYVRARSKLVPRQSEAAPDKAAEEIPSAKEEVAV